MKWQRDGLTEPAAVRSATEAYRSEMATFTQFIEDCCVEGPGQWIRTQDFQRAYQAWSEANGYRFPYGPQRVRQVLRGRGYVPEKRSGARGWRGVGLAEKAA